MANFRARIFLAIFLFLLCAHITLSQSQTNSAANSQVGAASDSNSNANTAKPEPAKDLEEGKVKKLRDSYKVVHDTSQSLSGWCLLIIAASVATIVSTSYFRPKDRSFRFVYLLFIPGWAFMALAIYSGIGISEGYISLGLVKTEYLVGITDLIDEKYVSQLFFFKGGLLIFALWLIVFLLFWILADKITTDK